ncbi:hypothetical protein BC936DRAFT_146653 [Jimgerdemannia flammicorona]|uniref:WD40-repeat-containing domain protein n=1 Tax=Jimgerdemannia flammicorona TaxID=994334 RepID=A0A433D721_9FUNG|nr:hypothetical protein BC936DRAFT_146653 [Jimgerdemannia flammicorona]
MQSSISTRTRSRIVNVATFPTSRETHATPYLMAAVSRWSIPPPTRRTLYIADTKHATIWDNSDVFGKRKKSKYVGERRVIDDISNFNAGVSPLLRIVNTIPPPPPKKPGAVTTPRRPISLRPISFSFICFAPDSWPPPSSYQSSRSAHGHQHPFRSGDVPAVLGGALDGKLQMAAVDQRGSIYLFHYGTNKYWFITRTGITGTALAFGRAARTELIIAFADRTMRSYNVETRETVADLNTRHHKSPVHHISLHPTSPLAITCSRTEAILWDTSDWTRVRVLITPTDLRQARHLSASPHFHPWRRSHSFFAHTGILLLIRRPHHHSLGRGGLCLEQYVLRASVAPHGAHFVRLVLKKWREWVGRAVDGGWGGCSIRRREGVGEWESYGCGLTIFVWDMRDRSLVREIIISKYVTGLVAQIEFVGSKTTLAILTTKGAMLLVDDPETPRAIARKLLAPSAVLIGEGSREVASFIVSPDGRFLALVPTTEKSVVEVWDMRNKALLSKGVELDSGESASILDSFASDTSSQRFPFLPDDNYVHHSPPDDKYVRHTPPEQDHSFVWDAEESRNYEEQDHRTSIPPAITANATVSPDRATPEDMFQQRRSAAARELMSMTAAGEGGRAQDEGVPPLVGTRDASRGDGRERVDVDGWRRAAGQGESRTQEIKVGGNEQGQNHERNQGRERVRDQSWDGHGDGVFRNPPDRDRGGGGAEARAPDGQARAPDGRARAPDGRARAPDGRARAPDDRARAPDGRARAAAGRARAAAGRDGEEEEVLGRDEREEVPGRDEKEMVPGRYGEKELPSRDGKKEVPGRDRGKDVPVRRRHGPTEIWDMIYQEEAEIVRRKLYGPYR